jgi:hypothetical protein
VAQGKGAVVKRGTDGQGETSEDKLRAPELYEKGEHGRNHQRFESGRHGDHTLVEI